MDALKPMLEGLPGYATIKKYMDKAAAAYKKISEFLGRIFNALKSVFSSIVDKIEEILDGFANQGLGYLKTLIKMVLGDAVYEIVEPVVDAVASTAEKIIELFETEPPTSVTDFFPWCLKLMKKVWSIGFDGIRQVASALWKMLENLVSAAKKIANYMVQKGMIGVQRHCYYIWKPIGPNYYFLAASQYKIHMLGFDDEHKEEGMLNNPKSAIGQVLFEVLEALDVPPTYEGWEPDAKESYRDRWVGDGAGVSLGQTVQQAMAQHQHKKREELPETPQRKGKPGSGMEPLMTRPPKA